MPPNSVTDHGVMRPVVPRVINNVVDELVHADGDAEADASAAACCCCCCCGADDKMIATKYTLFVD